MSKTKKTVHTVPFCLPKSKFKPPPYFSTYGRKFPTTFCSNFSRKSSCDYTFSKMQCDFSGVKN